MRFERDWAMCHDCAHNEKNNCEAAQELLYAQGFPDMRCTVSHHQSAPRCPSYTPTHETEDRMQRQEQPHRRDCSNMLRQVLRRKPCPARTQRHGRMSEKGES